MVSSERIEGAGLSTGVGRLTILESLRMAISMASRLGSELGNSGEGARDKGHWGIWTDNAWVAIAVAIDDAAEEK
ncbi:hypothetical protein ACEPAH_8340 [Sanghuangporus vaninii]